MTRSPFSRLVHADWSTTPSKRWAAEARWEQSGWVVSGPRLVGPIGQFLNDLLRGTQPTLAGFDFPIGVPKAFGQSTEFKSFGQAIGIFGTGRWSRFYEVAEVAADISRTRPFYPRVSSSSTIQKHLLIALGVDNINTLRRQCEKATPNRRAACSLFWTLGGNQVGKAAISGWREIVQPARLAGALLWPFDGELTTLAKAGKLVICETYPTEAYGHVGVRFLSGGKHGQDYRRKATANLLARCEAHNVTLTQDMLSAISDGFGPRKDGEDPFDAAIGLFGMIEVVEGRRAAIAGTTDAPEWEGWILGQTE